MRLNLKNTQRGFTLVEVTIILLVLVILSTIMLPQLGNFNRLARFVKVKEDVGALCSVMKKMLDEVMLGAFYEDPRPNGDGELPVGRLVGPGVTPVAGAAGVGNSGIAGDDGAWRGTGDEFEMVTDDGTETVTFQRGFLVDHLQTNNPAANGTEAYKNPLDNPERWAAGAFFGWRGPYLDELTADPWGHRYQVNSFGLYRPPIADSNATIFSSAVVCYSAGPDGGIDTIFNQPMSSLTYGGTGWEFGGDDVGAILSAGGPF